MGRTSFPIFCSACQTKLKRQVLGSNVIYYCRNCGRLSSEAYLEQEIKGTTHSQEPFTHSQEPLSVHQVSSLGTKLLKIPGKL